MKTRHLTYITVLLLTIIGVFFVKQLIQHKNRIKPTLASSPVYSVNENSNISLKRQSTSFTNKLGPSEFTLARTNAQRRQEIFSQVIEEKNKPIEFYGKVIDQDGNPLPAAKIDIGIRHWYVPVPGVMNEEAKQIHLEQISDSDGRFEFHGATGDGFGVVITKDGYELEQSKYGSGPTAGTYEEPIIFKMWSTNIHEHLITGNKSFDVVPDGRPYFINLINGTISESSAGDLKVWIKRPEPIMSRRYDWSCGIEAINGGVIQTHEVAMYQAPVTGYTNSFRYEENATANGWGDTTGEKKFYVMLNNGETYGRISIELEAYYNNQTPGLIRLSYAINPSGSRILR